MSRKACTLAVLPERVRAGLAQHCAARWPEETCGILMGDWRGGIVRVEDFRPVRNASREPLRSFMFDPEEWVRAFFEARKWGRDVVGVFHSHPDGRLSPSEADRKAQLPWGTCWIVGVSEGRCELAAYQPLDGGIWRPIPLAASLHRAKA